MPTYDYECDGCGHSWELFQKITDDKITKCPICNRAKARRLFGTGAAIVFKGSGFYQTDYRSESYKKGEKAASDSAASDSTDSKSESKSDPKTGDTAQSGKKEPKSKKMSSDRKTPKKPDSKR